MEHEATDRIFIGSTCYDLIDIRVELEQLIRDLGLRPILSDRPESEFTILPDRTSIETCLSNLRESDVAIFVLSQRYGPQLGKAGFEDVSATHLEFKEATQSKKKLFFFVRDRLDGDFQAWKANGCREDFNSRWAKGDDAILLFKFIEEARRLERGQETSNWIQTFQHSVDLKKSVKRCLSDEASSAILKNPDLVAKLPLISFYALELRFKEPSPWNGLFAIRNAGPLPALNLKMTGIYCNRCVIVPTGLPIIEAGRKTELDLTSTLERDLGLDPKGTYSVNFSFVYGTQFGTTMSDEYELIWKGANAKLYVHYRGKRLHPAKPELVVEDS